MSEIAKDQLINFEQNIETNIEMNIKTLHSILKRYQRVCVAFSGGIDSTVLLAVAKEILGRENVIAVTARGIMTSQEAYQNAIETAKNIGISCITVEVDAFQVPAFVSNDKLRCYYCKKFIFEQILRIAEENGMKYILEGSNLDDAKKYRPGKMAIEELGVKSPLAKAGFHKSLIRALAKELGLPEWNRPSESCLATRFPYNQTLTKAMFDQVGQAERLIKQSGITQCRVRMHGEIARIEVPQDDFVKFVEDKQLHDQIKMLGIKYITLDLEGFRSGSMDL